MAFLNPRVWFDVSAAGRSVGRLEIELFHDVLPITAENFRALTTGETGLGYWCKPRWYKGTKFHRIVPNFMAQGGDFNFGNGNMGESIYGKTFRDEAFVFKHSRRGLLSMAHGVYKHSNSSQFFFTLHDRLPHLDGKHVVFGHIVNLDWRYEAQVAAALRETRCGVQNPVSAERTCGRFSLLQEGVAQNGGPRTPGAGRKRSKHAAAAKLPMEVQGSYVLDEIERMGCEGGFPRYPVEVWDCGEYDRVKDSDRFVKQAPRPDEMEFRVDSYNPIPAEVWKKARKVVPARS
eukprot:g2906.t1